MNTKQEHWPILVVKVLSSNIITVYLQANLTLCTHIHWNNSMYVYVYEIICEHKLQTLNTAFM